MQKSLQKIKLDQFFIEFHTAGINRLRLYSKNSKR